MRVKWGPCVSAPFGVRNGVRQGGILFPILFNLCVDDLSISLNNCTTGCMIGNSLVNHIMYADDLVVLSPCSAGLQQLLNVCSEYGVHVHDMKLNADKRTRSDVSQVQNGR